MHAGAKILIRGISLWLFLGPTYAGPPEDERAAYQKGDYATALQFVRPLAEQGIAGAQYNLGIMHAEGQGVPQEDAEAVNWFRKAADQGDASANSDSGSCTPVAGA